MATKKATVNKINYLYILSSPLENKCYTDRKYDLKTFHTIKERVNFLIELSAEITMQIFEIVLKIWPKFKQVSKKVPTPRTLEPTVSNE